MATVRTRGYACPLPSRSVMASSNSPAAASRPVARRRSKSSAVSFAGTIAGVPGSPSTTQLRSDSRTSGSRLSHVWSVWASSTAASTARRTAQTVSGVNSLSRASRTTCSTWEAANSTTCESGRRCCSHLAAIAASTASAMTAPAKPGSPGEGPGLHSHPRTVIRPCTLAIASARRIGADVLAKASRTPCNWGIAARLAGPAPPSRRAWATAGASSRSYRIPGTPAEKSRTRVSICVFSPVPSSATAISIISSADNGSIRTLIERCARSSALSQSLSVSPGTLDSSRLG